MLQSSPNPTVRKTIEYARKLEGCNRSTGVHACAMIIAPEAIVDYVPLGVAKGSDMPVTQYEGKYVESVGLLKMDFLGLKTLTIIKNTLQNIKWRHNLDIDIDTIPLNDKKTYDLFGRGDTTAIFQFESDGMKKYLRELKPERFEDLIAMNALYRPGPMEYIPNFIRRKHGLEAITCDLPDMEDILSDTYGITVYQEHVMLLSQKLANFTGGEADTLRKAMGKKQLDTLVKMKDKFVSGCGENKLDSKTCDKIWDDWLAFANYAFNKSHAACYAYIAYQTAYLKAHYPAEFMAAVLTSNLGSIDQITFFIDDCLHQKIQVLPPDINESVGVFSVNKNGAIRFGLKGVGEGVVENIVNERNENGSYGNIIDFVSRSDLKALNRKAIESLVKSGAFDVFGKPSRHAYFYKANDNAPDFIEQILQYVKKSAQNSSIGSLFDDDTAGSSLEIVLPEVEEWSDFTKLMYEKEVAGYYISGHPLNKYELEIKQFANADIRQMNEMFKESSKYAGKSVRIAGMIAAAEHRQTRFNVPYGIFSIVDKDSSIRLSLFKDIYMKFGHFLVANPPTPVFCYATLTSRGFGDSINYDWTVNDMFLLDDLLDRNTHHIKLQVELSEINKELISDLHTLIEKYRVEKNPKVKQSKISDIVFIVKDTKSGVSVTMPSSASVEPSLFLHDLQSQEWFNIFDVTLS